MEVNEGGSSLLVEQRGHAAYLTINRPEVRNALDTATTELLVDTVADLGERDDVWVIVLRGAGEAAFCAGRDLKELNAQAGRGQQVVTPMTGPRRNHYEVVLETYKPTIAALNGAAVGGGCELALACDLRIAARHAVMGLPEAKRGMGANFASVVLPRLVSRGRAFELLYTGRYLEADEALDWGLVNQVVDAGELDDAVDALVDRVVANAPLSLRRYKEMAVKGWELPVPVALRLNVGPNPYTSKDREEGVRAYVEKRAPQWRGE